MFLRSAWSRVLCDPVRTHLPSLPGERAPRCLIIQSDGEHKGQDAHTPNWYLRECYGLQHAFRQNGWEADIWGLRHENFLRTPDFEAHDLLLCVENYEPAWLPDFSRIRRPLKLQWIIDLHCQNPRRYRRVSKGCDVILHSTRRLIAGYERLCPRQRHLWFPNAVDDRYFDAGKHRRPRTRDVIFVGSDLPERRAFIEDLRQRGVLQTFFATGQDMLELVSSAKIHFNRNVGEDINSRTFETIALGTTLLTNRDPDLEDLGFVDGRNCLTYRSREEAVAKIERTLRDGSWQEIGENGYRLSRRHTHTVRVKELLGRLCAAHPAL